MGTSEFRILKEPKEVLKYAAEIKDAADENRDALGFNPEGAYDTSITNGKIWVAVDKNGKYIGHLLHGGRPYQTLRIFQIFVADPYRKKGVSSALIQEAAEYGENISCLNMRADVASDLKGAIKFYESQGFSESGVRRKKNKSGRQILLYQRRLSTPSLLPESPVGLSISARAPDVVDSYVIDLNIFLTIAKGESDETLVSDLIKAALAGEFTIFITPELKTELARTPRDDDSVMALAEKCLPVLAAVDQQALNDLKEELRLIIFPLRKKDGRTAVQDESDLKHIAHTILSSKAGFITKERALLASAKKLKEKYDITILSPDSFKIEYSGDLENPFIDIPLVNTNGEVRIKDVKSLTELKPFFVKLGKNALDIERTLVKESGRSIGERKAVISNGNLHAAYISQTAGTKQNTLKGFWLPSATQFNNKGAVFEHLLQCFIRFSQTVKAEEIVFYVPTEDFDCEKIAVESGFIRCPASDISGMVALAKIPSPPIVTVSNWLTFRASVLAQTDIQLPRLIPQHKIDNDGNVPLSVSKSGKTHKLPLFDLENLISPSTILLPKREGVIIPIDPAYANELLARDSSTLQFDLTEEALFRREKVYFRGTRHNKLFVVGQPIIFYESGKRGRGAIGSGRISFVSICDVDNALKLYRRYGVLKEAQIRAEADKTGKIQVVGFDGFKEFPYPIAFKRLKEIGCGKASMIAPERVKFAELSQVLHEGLGLPSRDVMLSIQPEYVSQIMSGKKTIELRRKPFPFQEVTRTWIYTSDPTKAVEGVAKVSAVHKGSPEKIWETFAPHCGISKENYDKYFFGTDEAYALNLEDARRLTNKIKLERLKELVEGFTAPQYFRYVDHDSDLFRALIAELS